jgi:S-methylmethionine-dependent homocysteine/selenocysteine methylase
MTLATASLPQLGADVFLTDGGLETTLVFLEGVDLPCFAAFPLVDSEEGRGRLLSYYRPYLEAALAAGTGFVLSAPTWRANPDWAKKIGYSDSELRAANLDAVALAEEVRSLAKNGGTPVVIDGVLGPRGDGYVAENLMSPDEAQRYHSLQVETFADSAADMVSAITMTYPEEAIGIARAAKQAGMPSVVSFTVETDGRLPSGHALGEAIEQVDRETDGSPAYYMVNCAHPTHFAGVLAGDGAWRDLICGVRANASKMSHAELDEAEELDDGNPDELAGEYKHDLRPHLKNLNVLGGCCGTDHRHVGEIARTWQS